MCITFIETAHECQSSLSARQACWNSLCMSKNTVNAQVEYLERERERIFLPLNMLSSVIEYTDFIDRYSSLTEIFSSFPEVAS